MTTTTTLPAELTVPKANVTRTLGTGDDLRDRKARIVIAGARVRLFRYDGTPGTEARFVSSDYAGERSPFSLITDNGEHWSVKPSGCGCGGG